MNLNVFISNVDDGNMKPLFEKDNATYKNQCKFLIKNSIEPSDTTFVKISYNTDNFCKYKIINEDARGEGITKEPTMVADALVVKDARHALFLPIADCVGAVIFDAKKNILMMSHLGRHNLCEFGAKKSIEFLINEFKSNPKDIQVWLSPAAGKDNYPLFAFDNRSLADVAITQMVSAGISQRNINATNIDTTIDKTYYSHSQFLLGKQKNDYRFAIVAIMTQ